MQNSVKAFTDKFEQTLLLDFENTQQLVVGYTVIQTYDHSLSIFLLPRNNAWEIIKTRDDLKIAYNPDDII